MTDVYNNFVKVTIGESAGRIKVNCTFLNQPFKSTKSCKVVYGSNCNNLSSAIPASTTVDTTNSIVLNIDNKMDNKNLMIDMTKICFEVTASNISKTVKVVYDSGMVAVIITVLL